MKIEGDQGKGVDNTSANKLAFRCSDLKGRKKTEWYELGYTDWGEWKTTQFDFLEGDNKWVAMYSARIEGRQNGGDDSSMNGLKIWPMSAPAIPCKTCK